MTTSVFTCGPTETAHPKIIKQLRVRPSKSFVLPFIVDLRLMGLIKTENDLEDVSDTCKYLRDPSSHLILLGYGVTTGATSPKYCIKYNTKAPPKATSAVF